MNENLTPMYRVDRMGPDRGGDWVMYTHPSGFVQQFAVIGDELADTTELERLYNEAPRTELELECEILFGSGMSNSRARYALTASVPTEKADAVKAAWAAAGLVCLSYTSFDSGGPNPVKVWEERGQFAKRKDLERVCAVNAVVALAYRKVGEWHRWRELRTIEVRFRCKGEVVTEAGFHCPSVIDLPDTLSGIDMTGYPVIKIMAGRGYEERIKETRARVPGAVIVFRFEYRSGFGEGILLPDNFDPRRVAFYKGAAQVEAERDEANIETFSALADRIRDEIPGVLVHGSVSSLKRGEIEVWPQVGPCVFAFWEKDRPSWGFHPATYEAAVAGVESRRAMWAEWTTRAAMWLADQGLSELGHEGTLYVSGDRAGIGVDSRDLPEGGASILMKKGADGKWVFFKKLEGGRASYGWLHEWFGANAYSSARFWEE